MRVTRSGCCGFIRPTKRIRRRWEVEKRFFLKKVFGKIIVLDEVKVQVDMKEREVKVKVTGAENKGLWN